MPLTNILNEPEGSDITVFNVAEYVPFKHKNEGRDDMLFITYKDSENRKKVRAIRDPKLEIFFVRPEYRPDFFTPREYLEIDKTYSKIVSARAVVPTIFHELQNCTDSPSRVAQAMYYQATAAGNHRAAREVLKWPYTLMSDMSVEDYYRIMLGFHYNTMRNHLIDKCFLDIEADVYGLSTTEQQANLDKVNACTLIFSFDVNHKEQRKPQVYTLLLRDHERYPQQEYFEKHQKEFLRMMHEEMDHQTVTKDGKSRVIDFEADYHLMFFDEEADLLVAIWTIVNRYKPDLLSVWNIAYDIPKIAARLANNGLDYRDVMCDPAFPREYRFVEMNIDTRPSIDIADRKTYIRMASTTVFNDQMQSYAGIRKGRKAYGSNKLDNISKRELGVGKYSFGKGIDVTNAAIKDYWNFVKYNIIDVIRQWMIDLVTNDGMAMVFDMNQANCPWENLFKQTRYQKQIYYTWYLRKGFVPGNNPNISYIRGETEESLERLEELRMARSLRFRKDLEADGEETVDDDPEEPEDETADPEEDFDEEAQAAAESVADGVLNIYEDNMIRKLRIPGGMVGNPDFNSDNGTELMDGIASKHVFDYVVDMDYASEYPWAKFTRSLSKSTQIGRLIIPEKISDRQNVLPMGQPKRIEEIRAYLPGAEFVEDLISGDVISLGNVWFNLPTVAEMNAMLEEELLATSKEVAHV